MVKDYMEGKSAVKIAESIELAIQRGRLSGNDSLPSVREAAMILGVNRNTVTQAYARLRERGWVYGRGRGGTRVTPLHEEEDAFGEASAFPGIVDLASGNIDPSLLPPLKQVAANVDWQQTGYDRSGEDPELLGLFRDMLTSEGIPVDSMMLGHSALDLIERALRVQAQMGEKVVVEDPVWPPLLALLRSLGLVVEPVPLDDQGVVPEALAESLGAGVAAVILTPRAQNPTGIDLPAERLDRIQGMLRNHPRTMLILDDHWGPLSEAPPPVIDAGAPGWLLVRSVSKFLGPDLRLAVAVGDADTVSRMARQFALGPRWISRLVQGAAVALLRDEQTQTQLQTAETTYALRHKALIEALRRYGFPVRPGSGINLWLPVKNEAVMVERMAARGYRVQAGHPFRLRSGPGVRVSVGNLPEEDADAVAGALAECSRGGSTPMV